MVGSREIFYDKIIVPCAIILSDSGQVLVQSIRDDKQIDGLWEFPGGKARHGEDIVKELIREVKEETDIVLNQDYIAPLTFNVFRNKLGVEYLVMFFLCSKWNGTPKARENQDLLWVDIQNLETLPLLAQNKKIVSSIIYFLQKDR